jgi:hypothetical protein
MHNALRRCALILACTLMTTTAHAQTLRIGLADPDVLDPARAKLRRPHRVRRALRQAARHHEKLNIAPQPAASTVVGRQQALTIRLR